MRILILDDYRTHAESLVDLLESLGHEAIAARDSGDADWLLQLFRFDLAILDFDMPERSGPAVARDFEIRYPEMPSIIMSAHRPEGARRRELGALPFLPKPLDRSILDSLLNAVLRCQAGSPLVLRAFYPVVKYEQRESQRRVP